MKKNIGFSLLLLALLPTLAFGGIRLPYICYNNGWLTITARSESNSLAVFCVLPDGKRYDAYQLENDKANNKNKVGLFFEEYVGILPSTEQIEQAKKAFEDEGYTNIGEIYPNTQ